MNIFKAIQDDKNEVVSNLTNKRISIFEVPDAPLFYIQINEEGTFEVFKKDGSKVSRIERIESTFYENLFNYLNTYSNIDKEEVPINWKFFFYYLPVKKVNTVAYINSVKNHMVLSHIAICKENGNIKKTITDPLILNKWADTLNIEQPLLIFNDIITGDKLELIVRFLENYKHEISREMDSTFTKQFVRMISNNPLTINLINQTTDMEVKGFNIISQGEDKKIVYRLDNPKVEKIYRNQNHNLQLILNDITVYLSDFKFTELKLKGESATDRYIEVINVLFKKYITERSHILMDIELKDEDSILYDINFNELDDDNVTILIQKHKIFKFVYKLLLTSLRRRKTGNKDIISKENIENLNKMIQKIESLVNMKNEDWVSFSQYKNLNESEELNEALKVLYPEHGKIKVNFMVGRFQPFTLGHLKVCKQIYEANGLPVVIMIIKSAKKKKDDAEKRPYDEKTQVEMIKAVMKTEKFIQDVIVVEKGGAGIDNLYNHLRPKYEPVLWGTGTDRYKAYENMVNKPEYREQLNVLPELDVFEIHRTDDNISATKVRNAMLEDDIDSFKEMTPKALHSMFQRLQEIYKKGLNITESMEILSFKDFINEGRNIEVKRKYREYESKQVGSFAKVRNKVIQKVGEGITKDFFDRFCEEENISKRWIRENFKKFFKTTESVNEYDGSTKTMVVLSKWGERVNKAIKQN